MDTEDIELELRGLRPRGAPPVVREQVLGAPRAPKRPPAVAIAALAALWLLVGVSHWWGLRADGRLSEGRAPLEIPPPRPGAAPIADRAEPLRNSKP